MLLTVLFQSIQEFGRHIVVRVRLLFVQNFFPGHTWWMHEQAGRCMHVSGGQREVISLPLFAMRRLNATWPKLLSSIELNIHQLVVQLKSTTRRQTCACAFFFSRLSDFARKQTSARVLVYTKLWWGVFFFIFSAIFLHHSTTGVRWSTIDCLTYRCSTTRTHHRSTDSINSIDCDIRRISS